MKEENVNQIKSRIMINSMPLLIRFNKIDGFIKVWDGIDIWYYLEVKNMIPFKMGSNTL